MTEYIEREAAVMRLMQDGCSAKNVQTIMTLPATDVAPVVHGRWLEKKTWSLGRWVSWFECSECGDRDYNAEMYEAMPFCNVSNYCPNCGAKMGDAE